MASSPSSDYIRQLIQERAQAYGIDPALLSRIAKVESSYDPRAGASTSSAKGLFQFTNPTWGQYGRGNVYDPAANADAGARFTLDNIKALQRSGQNVTPGNVYLSHFLGAGDAGQVLRADPRTPLRSIPTASMQRAIRANPFLGGMTAGDVQQWSARKMGGLFDPAVASASGTSGPAAQLGPRPTSITPTAVGFSPEDRAALASFAPALPAPVNVAAATPAPTPSGIDQSSVDRVNVLNPANRAAVEALYPPGSAAPPLPAPTAVGAPVPAAAVPSGTIPGAVAPAPALPPPTTVPPSTVTVQPGSQEEQETIAAHADEQPGGGLLNLTDEQAANATSFASRLPGILNAQNQELTPPELTPLPTRGTLESPIASMVRQAKQQKIQQGLAQIKSTGYPQPQQRTV